MTPDYKHHDYYNGGGCLIAPDSDLPEIPLKVGARHNCVCGRAWIVTSSKTGPTWSHADAPKACGFCTTIKRGEFLRENNDAVLISPRSGGIGPNHLLVVPRKHVERFETDPNVMARAMRFAATVAPLHFLDFNIIVNAGVAAGQTAFHLHIHILGRELGDHVTMPWPDKRPERDTYVDTMIAIGLRP